MNFETWQLRFLHNYIDVNTTTPLFTPTNQSSRVVLAEVSADDHPLSRNQMTSSNPSLADSSQEMIGSRENRYILIPEVRSTDGHKLCYRRSFCLSCFAFTGLFIITVAIQNGLFSTIPYPVSGKILLATNMIRQLSFNPSDIDHVTFSGTDAATFYHSKCSDIETERQKLHIRRILRGTVRHYRMQPFYFIKNSLLNYKLTVQPMLINVNSCAAMVHIFNSYSNYYQFFTSGHVHEAISYCLPHNAPLNFNISAIEEDRYYFLALESFANTTIRFRITGDLLKYNVTSLPRTTCIFLSTNCSISLSGYPRGEDVCIIATLQETNKFVYQNVNYTTQLSKRWKTQKIAYWVFIALSFGLPFILVIIMLLLTISLYYYHYQDRAQNIMLKEFSVQNEI